MTYVCVLLGVYDGPAIVLGVEEDIVPIIGTKVVGIDANSHATLYHTQTNTPISGRGQARR